MEKRTPDVPDLNQRRAIRERRRARQVQDPVEAAVNDLDDDFFYDDEEQAIAALLKLIRKGRDRTADARRGLKIAGDD